VLGLDPLDLDHARGAVGQRRAVVLQRAGQQEHAAGLDRLAQRHRGLHAGVANADPHAVAGLHADLLGVGGGQLGALLGRKEAQ
jgi:hypothetical protein